MLMYLRHQINDFDRLLKVKVTVSHGTEINLVQHKMSLNHGIEINLVESKMSRQPWILISDHLVPHDLSSTKQLKSTDQINIFVLLLRETRILISFERYSTVFNGVAYA